MKKKRSFLAFLRDFFGVGIETVIPEDTTRLRLSGKGTRIPLQGVAFEIEMGKQRVYIYPDFPVDDNPARGETDYLLFDPQRYFSEICHFLRLRKGQKLVIDRNDESQVCLFTFPRDAFRRHLQISHEGDALVFRDPISELGSYVSVIDDKREATRITARRRQVLQQLVEIFGGPIKMLATDEALSTLKKVNKLLKKERYRRSDTKGNKGGLLELPDHLVPIIVGDLHAQLENLLKILTENTFFEALQRGDAALILLGDMVHPEDEGELSSMDSSIEIMDLILKLKLHFPDNIFLLLGNHDSFSHDVMKGGVPQGLLWEKRITYKRGEAYKKALELFYSRLPLVAISKHFVACHAGPTRRKISREILVNVRRHPKILRELTWTRVKTPRFPAGYTRADARRFRKGLGLSEDVPFIVAHYPLTREATVWLNIRGIPQHHIVFSALPDQVGVFTRIENDMLAQIYPAESLREWANRQVSPPSGSG